MPTVSWAAEAFNGHMAGRFDQIVCEHNSLGGAHGRSDRKSFGARQQQLAVEDRPVVN
jgi:hypothetical protein